MLDIKVKTQGGYDAHIKSYDPTDKNCFHGTLTNDVIGTMDQQWDISGIASNTNESANISQAINYLKNIFK